MKENKQHTVLFLYLKFVLLKRNIKFRLERQKQISVIYGEGTADDHKCHIVRMVSF